MIDPKNIRKHYEPGKSIMWDITTGKEVPKKEMPSGHHFYPEEPMPTKKSKFIQKIDSFMESYEKNPQKHQKAYDQLLDLMDETGGSYEDFEGKPALISKVIKIIKKSQAQ